MDRRLASLREVLLTELRKLDGEQTAYGVIKLETSDSFPVTAYLQVGSKKMAWFKVAQYHGVYSHDECDDVPYVEPNLKIRVYPPNPKDFDGSWDIVENRPCFNGGWEETCNDKPEELAKFFEKMADHLSTWF